MKRTNKKEKQSERLCVSFTESEMKTLVRHVNKKNMKDGTTVKVVQFVRALVNEYIEGEK